MQVSCGPECGKPGRKRTCLRLKMHHWLRRNRYTAPRSQNMGRQVSRCFSNATRLHRSHVRRVKTSPHLGGRGLNTLPEHSIVGYRAGGLFSHYLLVTD